MIYIGRFAPSPTGPLHFGSLVAAVGSYLDARAHGGIWRVRMEDLDSPRETPGAAEGILKTLERFGFEWDGPVLYQSHRLDSYHEVIERLLAQGEAYPCGCTRSEIADSGLHGLEGPIYPGTCRSGLAPGKAPRAIRFRVNDVPVQFTDLSLGPITQNLEREIGDFIIRRADGYIAYQLAVVVDDAWQGITHVVRGGDLLLSTPRQISLQVRLGLGRPVYFHLPIAVNSRGEKLSKQTRAPSLEDAVPGPVLHRVLTNLRQSPPPDLASAPLPEIWDWAIWNWRRQTLQGLRTIPAI